jgi:opacity protein-like surface antigen
MMKRLLTIAIVTLAAGMAAPATAVAQSLPLPTPVVEEVMVKTSLLTLNDANLTGNYAVMYAKMAKPFRDKFTADTLKQAFKAFAGKHVDIIAAKPIVPTSAAKFGSNGWLMLRGYFDTAPSRLNYELDFAVSEGEWKLIAIDVKVRDQSTSDAGGLGLLTHATTDFSAAGK